MFLPTTIEEVKKLGWKALDVVLVTGDAYIDSPFIGVSVIGKVLLDKGFRVGIIAQPDMEKPGDITRLGEPELFWGVTAGSIDSLVANRTATGKRRKSDDYTPGGVNNKRPDRALIKYCNLIRRNFKETKPIVVGGIEASLRRIAHYDFWTDKVRKSILFDAKADYLVCGMGERTVVELAKALKEGKEPRAIRGLSYIAKEKPEGIIGGVIELPSFKKASNDKKAFEEMFMTFYYNNDPVIGRTLVQKYDDRYLVQNPPARYLESEELDKVYALKYELDLHPYYKKRGKVKALETIRFSIPTHRGCYGECSFCAIAVHEGRRVRSRSKGSIVSEAKRMAGHPAFKGTIHDLGGPTANMYAIGCTKMDRRGGCKDKHCLLPKTCASLQLDHGAQIKLLKEVRGIKGVKHVFVSSGIRYDMILADKKNGERYLDELVNHHVSGQMKIAPEHTETRVLELMQKPGPEALIKFRELFYKLTKKAGKKQFLTYYLIAAHPGCTEEDMKSLRSFAERELKLLPEQVQVFTPTPSTISTLIYYTGRDPFTGNKCFVERTFKGKETQKRAVEKTGGGYRGKGGFPRYPRKKY